MEDAERRLSAVLHADIAGFSRLMAADDLATVRAVSALRDEVGSLVRDHAGRLVDFIGDNFLAEFPSVLRSVSCALALQHAFEERNQTLPPDRKLLFRIGVHLGDVIVDGARIYGDPLNAAARIQAIAVSGGICLSGAVFDQVRHHLDEAFEDLGPRWLKNLPDAIRVFRLRPGTPTETEQREALSAGDRAERRLAVLLVCDGAGYTHMSARDEIAAYEALAALQDSLSLIVREARGRVVDVIGDGLFAEFATATAGVSCALAIQAAVERANRGVAEDRRLAFRIAVHMDEVIVRGERLYGQGVNAAHRLARLTPGGEIHLSSLVVDGIEGKLDVAVEEHSDPIAVGLKRPVRVFRVLQVASGNV